MSDSTFSAFATHIFLHAPQLFISMMDYAEYFKTKGKHAQGVALSDRLRSKGIKRDNDNILSVFKSPCKK